MVPGILDPADWDKGADWKEPLFFECRLLVERREGACADFMDESRSGTMTTGMAPSDKTLLRDLALEEVLAVAVERTLVWWLWRWFGLAGPLLLLIIRFATSLAPPFDSPLGRPLVSGAAVAVPGGVISRSPYCFLVCRSVLL